MQNKLPPPAEITVAYDQFQLFGILQWIEANGYKPHVLIDTKFPGVALPPQCMAKPQEIINLHFKACGKFTWEDDRIKVQSRFGGKDYLLVIPYRAIMAVNFAGTGNWVPLPWTAIVAEQPIDAQAVVDEANAMGPALEHLTAASEEPKVTTIENVGNTVRHVDFSRGRNKG